jgi:hydroxymethylpyrimidine/phosphomethylpyrimidine kinase
MTQNQANERVPCVLCLGGLDPCGGAGLTADARALSAFGAHALPVITAVVAQNTRGVSRWEAVAGPMVAAQLETLLEDVRPDAVKIGLLPDAQAAGVTCRILRELLAHSPHLPIIWDTVLAPSSGPTFVYPHVVRFLSLNLPRLCDLVTPNISEAAQLTGHSPAATVAEMRETAQTFWKRHRPHHVLVKGGHLPGEDTPDSVDVLFDGEKFLELRAPRVEGYGVRGTGCLLASAIAAQRAQGVPIPDAVRAAKTWLSLQIQNAQAIGGGSRVAI